MSTPEPFEPQNIRDREYKAFRRLVTGIVKAVLVENDSSNPIPVVDVGDSVKNYLILNEDLTDENTRYEIALPNNTKRFTMKIRDALAQAKIYNDSMTSEFYTLPRGAVYSSESINVDNGFNVYVQASKPSVVLELWCWVS